MFARFSEKKAVDSRSPPLAADAGQTTELIVGLFKSHEL